VGPGSLAWEYPILCKYDVMSDQVWLIAVYVNVLVLL